VQEQRFVYARPDRSMLAVVTISSINDSGTPIDPDNGDDLQYLGITTEDVEPREYWADLHSFELIENAAGEEA
jgi:hypothetical protein